MSRRKPEPKAPGADPVVSERVKLQHSAKRYFKDGVGHPMKLKSRSELRMEDRPALLPGRSSKRPRANVWVRA